MNVSCAFCGSTEPRTREHVMGRWLCTIGLDSDSVTQMAGPLNGIPRSMGTQAPFQLTVKDFCAACNSGWMSRLEEVAKRVLTPLILAKSTTIDSTDKAALAMWVQKTALTAMLLSSREQRESGYGLPPSEYAALYERSGDMRPLDASRFWIGRYEGRTGFSCVRVAPLEVRLAGDAGHNAPHGYLTTIVIGGLAVQGLRFTTPDLEVETQSQLGMPELWPTPGPVQAPEGRPCTEASFLQFANGKLLRAVEPVEILPWGPAVDLPPSEFAGEAIKVPALCRKHFFFYPKALMTEALRGHFYAFVTACECPTWYLILTAHDGAHCRAAGAAEGVARAYASIPGRELMLSDDLGDFACKELTTT